MTDMTEMTDRLELFVKSQLLRLVKKNCKKDFLDRNPLDSVSSQIFWASEADVETALTGVYTRLQQNFLGYERVYLDGLTDNAFLDVNGNQGNLHTISTGNLSPALGGALSNMYTSPYRAISSANYFFG